MCGGCVVNAMKVDWDSIAEALGSRHGGDSVGCQAIEIIIGEAAIKDAVERFVRGDSASEIIRSVLNVLRPASARNHCHQIFKSQRSIEERRSAVDLLRSCAVRETIGWVCEFLADSDEGIQNWGASLADQLAFGQWIQKGDCEPLIARMNGHPNSQVRWHLSEMLKSFAQNS